MIYPLLSPVNKANPPFFPSSFLSGLAANINFKIRHKKTPQHRLSIIVIVCLGAGDRLPVRGRNVEWDGVRQGGGRGLVYLNEICRPWGKKGERVTAEWSYRTFVMYVLTNLTYKFSTSCGGGGGRRRRLAGVM